MERQSVAGAIKALTDIASQIEPLPTSLVPITPLILESHLSFSLSQSDKIVGDDKSNKIF